MAKFITAKNTDIFLTDLAWEEEDLDVLIEEFYMSDEENQVK